MLETPSRIWRRIEAVEAHNMDMPSLPSLPALDDSVSSDTSNSFSRAQSPILEQSQNIASPHLHSTPATSSRTATRSTTHPFSSTSQTARLGDSVHGDKSLKSLHSDLVSSTVTVGKTATKSLRISDMSPDALCDGSDVIQQMDVGNMQGIVNTQFSISADEEGDELRELSFTDALEPDSGAELPIQITREYGHGDDSGLIPALSEKYDFSISLRSESRPFPKHDLRNISSLCGPLPKDRVPSLSRTTPSPSSSSSNSTPRSAFSTKNLPCGSISPLSFHSPLRENLEHSEQNLELHNPQHRSLSLETNETDRDSEKAEDNAHDESRKSTTFPSEDDEIPSHFQGNFETHFASASTALTSPGLSTIFTPTPVFQHRSSARTNTHSPLYETQQEFSAEDPATPHTRRRSFLLSVINSTARPRMSFPTPHPHALPPYETNVSAGVTPGPRITRQIWPGTATTLRRPRSSHPLAQVYTVDPVTPTAGSGSGEGDRKTSISSNISFVSTASSHDLTVHPRANASFDPLTGAQGVGRFNALKLNSYLHGLNRRLQEENEALVERLTIQQHDILQLKSRRGSGELSEVTENVGAEAWLQEKGDLERQIDGLKTEVEARDLEKRRVLEVLEQERRERIGDKENWKERMREVEKGVENIVKGLEKRAEDAERRAVRVDEAELKTRNLQSKLESLTADYELMKDRTQKAEYVMASEPELGGELKEANEKVSRLSGELQLVNSLVKQVQEQLVAANERAEGAETKLKAEEESAQTYKKELQVAYRSISTSQDQIRDLEHRHRIVNEDLLATRSRLTELETDTSVAKGRIESLEQQLALVTPVENALAEIRPRTSKDEEQLIGHRAKITSQDRATGSPNLTLRRDGAENDFHREYEVNIEGLEADLDEANREIGRLTTILSQSPARKAIENAKDIRIEALENERNELAERLRDWRNGMTFDVTRSIVDLSGMSPVHRRLLSMHMKTPKTPGEPLRDLSWLHDNVTNSPASPLLAEINRLQRELDKANESIDDKLDKLDAAGLGFVKFTKELEDARALIVDLEGQVANLSRKDVRRTREFERAMCMKCRTKFCFRGPNRNEDSSLAPTVSNLPSNPPTSSSKTNEVLRFKLQSVNAQLETMKAQWDDERDVMINDINRLNSEIESARVSIAEAAITGQAKEQAQGELDKANIVIGDLENALRKERSRLRSITIEQATAAKEKDDILSQLRRTEADMNDVRTQFQHLKHANAELETELRENNNLEQNARHLEVKLAENNGIIALLREERKLLTDEHTCLQWQLAEATKQIDELCRKHENSRISHDERRYQLDHFAAEIEDLRSTLSKQTNELKVVQTEKFRVATERTAIQNSVAGLEADFKRVRQDAEVFGRDLKNLRAERDQLEAKYKEELANNERVSNRNQTRIQLLNEQLEEQREDTKRAIDRLNVHACVIDNGVLEALKLQHKTECKGLIVQIRYLKAKYTRESSLRADLGYQKKYLLKILAQYEKSERRVIASVTNVGFPEPAIAVCQKRKSLKTVVLLAVFVLRIRRASNLWREQSASKQDIANAFQDVKRKREMAS